MPFGIKTAPQHYQKKIKEILEGLDCRTQEEHDSSLRAVLKKLDESGATLNPEKCEFFKKVWGPYP